MIKAVPTVVFQHAAARRRLNTATHLEFVFTNVSTRSRPKAAEQADYDFMRGDAVSTRSRPKAADSTSLTESKPMRTFQHAAARRRLIGLPMSLSIMFEFQHAAARRRLSDYAEIGSGARIGFQHAAARRRLKKHFAATQGKLLVSTRSRPKAAE